MDDILPPTATTNRLLDIQSRNRCAFPDCNQLLSDYDNKTITGIRCHIKGQRPNGPRYDPTQTEEERHGFENLVMMCSKHSKIIDFNPDVYTVEKLLEMKRKHEESSNTEIPSASITKEFERVHESLADIKKMGIQGGKNSGK